MSSQTKTTTFYRGGGVAVVKRGMLGKSLGAFPSKGTCG
jgi:hypothetical protein